MKTLLTDQMEVISAGIIFDEKWCEENERKLAWNSVVGGLIAIIPTPPTVIYGTAWSLITGSISILCSY